MAVKSSIGLQGKFLNIEIKKKLKSFKSIKEGEVNPDEKKKVTNLVFEVGADTKPIPKLVNHLEKKFGLMSSDNNSYDFGTLRGGKAITHRVNFIIKKISQKTPTKVFEKGTTEVFNQALEYAPASYWAPDGVHPSIAGSQLMANAWLNEIYF